MEEQYSKKRKFVEIEKNLAGKLELLCFLKDVPEKAFVSRAVEKELTPYETWLERVKKLKASYAEVQSPSYQRDS